MTRARVASTFALVGVLQLSCTDVGDFPTTTTLHRPTLREASDAAAPAVPDAAAPRVADAANDAHGEPEAATKAPSTVPRFDAGGSEIDAGPVDPYSAGVEQLYAIFGARSADCRTCAEANCPSPVEACARLPGKADGGRDKGAEKASLCTQTLSCVIDSGCAANHPLDCYCGAAIVEQCASTASGAEGACADVIAQAQESDDPRVILSRLEDHSYEGGWALSIAQCLIDNACTSCFDEPARDD
ncbi:MAG TPA: hypothetical protein VHC69_00345 [Polyangiaceae bacterium]|nr:hypothetical protein [Polyangiaceae bacterium]